MEEFHLKNLAFQRTKWADAATDQLKLSYGQKRDDRGHLLSNAGWANGMKKRM